MSKDPAVAGGLRISPPAEPEDEQERARRRADAGGQTRRIFGLMEPEAKTRPIVCPDCRSGINWLEMPGFLSITPPPSTLTQTAEFRMIPIKLGSCDACLRVFLYRLTPEEQVELERQMRGKTVVNTTASGVLAPRPL